MRSTGRAPRPDAPVPTDHRPPPWRAVHLLLGLFFLGCAGALWLIAEGRSEFSEWFTAGLILGGGGLCVYGIARLRDPAVKPSNLDQLHPKHFFLEVWHQMDEEAREERRRREEAGEGYDYAPLIVLCFGAVFLTLMEVYGGSSTFRELLVHLHGDSVEPTVWSRIQDSELYQLYGFCWWSGWRVLGYFLLPCVTIWAMGKRVREHGLETRGFSQHAWIYGFAFVIVFVLVVIVSYTESFSTYYPFYKNASRSWFEFVTWEILYAAQFFSLEFFFRGYWLKALKPTMGSHAIFVMCVPYCMIHFGKPPAEVLVAIIAGIFLGTLAMKTRSIWSGFLIHVSVAVSMDVAAILQTAELPTRWWPFP